MQKSDSNGVMQSSAGAQKLQERILDEARRDADVLINGARVRANEILQEGERICAQIAMEGETQAQRNDNELLSKNRTQAELEAKKNALKSRYKLLDEVFLAASQKIMESDPQDADIVRFMYKTLVNQARGGETIRPSVVHRPSIMTALAEVNQTLKSSNRAPLTLGETEPLIQGGFILESANYTKDCSLKAILEEARDDEIINVSNKLFG